MMKSSNIFFTSLLFLTVVLPALAPGRPAQAAEFPEKTLFTARVISDLQWKPDSSGVFFNADGALHLARTDGVEKLADGPGAVSPDARSIIYTDPASQEMIVKMLDTGKVLKSGIKGGRPRWSPDGKKIAFYSEKQGCPYPDDPPEKHTAAIGLKCPRAELTVVDYSAHELTPLASGFRPGDTFAWLANSTGIIYYRGGEVGLYALGHASNPLVTAEEEFPPVASWTYTPEIVVAAATSTPRAAMFIYRPGPQYATGTWGMRTPVRLIAFDTRTLVPLGPIQDAWYLTKMEGAEGARAGGIAWSPDGSQLAFTGRDRESLFVSFISPGKQAGQPVNLRVKGAPLAIAWSPDGRWLAMALATFRSGGVMKAELLVIKLAEQKKTQPPPGKPKNTKKAPKKKKKK